MHTETAEEVRLTELAKAREPKALGRDSDFTDIGADPDRIFVVQAKTYGNVCATASFLTNKEATEFRDECIAFEATRYTEREAALADPAGTSGYPGYCALREDFDARHPWKRFSRGVEFVVRTQTLGRPIKAQA